MVISRRAVLWEEVKCVRSLGGVGKEEVSPFMTEGIYGRPGPAVCSCGYPQLEYGHQALNQQPQQLYLSPFGHLVLVDIQRNYFRAKYIWR